MIKRDAARRRPTHRDGGRKQKGSNRWKSLPGRDSSLGGLSSCSMEGY